jgi:septal ring factor EnvC (AmiA/AmiB activator)
MTRKIKIAIFCVLFWGVGFPAAVDTTQKQKELDHLRKEIAIYEKKLSEKMEIEKNTLNLISGLDREIDVATSYLRSLRVDVSARERQIDRIGAEIRATTEDLDKLKEVVKNRLVSFYKHRRRRDYELLLTNRSFGQLASWMRYQKMVTENDRRTLKALKDRRNELHRLQNLHRAEVDEKEQNIRTYTAEEKRLRQSRAKRSEVLSNVQKNREFLQQQLDEVRQAERQIRGLITRAEEQRLTRNMRKSPARKPADANYLADRSFSELKGTLIWPTQGEIVSHFGRYRHPTLRTITENLGVEIKAKLGTPVFAVCDGEVQTITWQRGRGNIIIISHGEGFYTVYTHLAEIRVELSDVVKQGQVIGTVGDSGARGSPILHFQIWKNTRNLDPEDWLA